VVPSDEDSLYAEHAQLMVQEKAKMQDAMDAKRLAVPSVQGCSGEISTQESHDLVIDSRPIAIALPYDLPNLINNKPQESKEMVLLRSKEEQKDNRKLEKRRIT
jgi:hypothetical protein